MPLFDFEESYEVIESLPHVNAPVTHESFPSLDFPLEFGIDDDAINAVRFDHKKATFILEKYLRKYPGNTIMLCWLARCYRSIGQKKGAGCFRREPSKK